MSSQCGVVGQGDTPGPGTATATSNTCNLHHLQLIGLVRPASRQSLDDSGGHHVMGGCRGWLLLVLLLATTII